MSKIDHQTPHNDDSIFHPAAWSVHTGQSVCRPQHYECKCGAWYHLETSPSSQYTQDGWTTVLQPLYLQFFTGHLFISSFFSAGTRRCIIKKQGPAELLPKYYSHQSKQAGKNYKRSTSLITPMKKKIKTYKKSLKKD